MLDRNSCNNYVLQITGLDIKPENCTLIRRTGDPFYKIGIVLRGDDATVSYPSFKDHIEIIASCARGHEQSIKIQRQLGIEFAKQQAALLDGSSAIYVQPPGQDSPIGKCRICRAPITCRVEA